MKNTYKYFKNAEKSVGSKATKRSATGGFLKLGQKGINALTWIALKTQSAGITADELIDGDIKVKDVMIEEYSSQIKGRVKTIKKMQKRLKKTKKPSKRKEMLRDIKSIKLSVKYYEKLLSKARR